MFRRPRKDSRPKPQPQQPEASDPEAQPSRADVKRLHHAEAQLADRLVTLRAERLQAEDAAGDAVLAAALLADTAPAASQVHAIVAVIAATERAIAQAREERRTAILAVYRQEAAPLRAQATRLRSEAEQRQRVTDDLLAKLKAHEEATYGPIDYSPPRGVHATSWPANRPRTLTMRSEAAALDAKAQALESRGVLDAGELEAASTDALIQMVRDLPADQIGPTVESVRGWAEPLQRAHEQREQRVTDSEFQARHALRLVLVWRNGTIDTARSEAQRVQVSGPRDRATVVSMPANSALIGHGAGR